MRGREAECKQKNQEELVAGVAGLGEGLGITWESLEGLQLVLYPGRVGVAQPHGTTTCYHVYLLQTRRRTAEEQWLSFWRSQE